MNYLDLIPSIINVVDDLFTTDEEQGEIELKKLAMNNEYELKNKEIVLKANTALLNDKDSARGMQKEALKQDDLLAKNFVYGLAIIILVSVLIFTYEILTREELTSNPMSQMVVGALLGVFTTVVSFFFGSSMGSKDKTILLSRGK